MPQQAQQQQAAQQQQLSRTSSCASLGSQQPRCRLCWGDETDDAEHGRLISPCNCKGTMQYIHLNCLKHWLDVTRQQGRRRALRCEVCNSKYRDARSLHTDGELLPSVLHDPYTIASLLHGALRAYVSISGLLRAYSVYRSIQSGAATSLLPPRDSPAFSEALKYAFSGSSSNTPGAIASSSRSRQLRQQQQQQRGLQQHMPGPVSAADAPLRHLSLSIPLGGSSSGSGSSHQDVLAAIRERFDKATMVQVYWYTALLALAPQPPNADAFAGMALGAAIGGMMAQLVFLPILGSGKLAALGHSCKLLLRCLVRLLAAEACQARGYRLLAAAVRCLMQQQWRRRVVQQLRRRLLVLPWLAVRRRLGRQPAAVEGVRAAAGLEVLLQQGE